MQHNIGNNTSQYCAPKKLPKHTIYFLFSERLSSSKPKFFRFILFSKIFVRGNNNRFQMQTLQLARFDILSKIFYKYPLSTIYIYMQHNTILSLLRSPLQLLQMQLRYLKESAIYIFTLLQG